MDGSGDTPSDFLKTIRCGVVPPNNQMLIAPQ